MTALPKRALGRTGLSTTVLGYGAMELRDGGTGALPARDAERLLNAVLDTGINFIDTSIDYGRSEELIGRFIAHRRDEYYLASKCGCVIGGGFREHVHTAENIRAGVEHSLKLLRTDYLDLVQFHRSLTKDQFEAEGALQEAMKLKAEGKVRFVGVSATLPNMLEQIEMGVFDVFQVPYSALQREHEDAIARASGAGAGIVIRGGVARGAPSDWENRTYYMMPGSTMRDRWQAATLDELLDGMDPIEFMLRFTLSHPDADTVIVGTKNPEHLRANAAYVSKGALPEDLLAEAKRRLREAGSKPEPV
jgi:aryl-alcohol dehydrogenase-like predicted oxidoreductase